MGTTVAIIAVLAFAGFICYRVYRARSSSSETGTGTGGGGGRPDSDSPSFDHR